MHSRRRPKGMREDEDEPRPYRYNRSFQTAPAPRQVFEMDKEALEAYIKKILAPKDPATPEDST